MEELEVHITIPSTVDTAELQHRLGVSLKETHIVLASGDSPSQLMVSYRVTSDVESVVRSLDLESEQIVRLKVETAPRSALVPSADLRAPGQYFERHVKVEFKADGARAVIEEIAFAHDARLSRNAFRKRDDGYSEYFLTQRYFGDVHEFEVAGESLLEQLTREKVQVLEVENEFVVYDSNFDLDRGWT